MLEEALSDRLAFHIALELVIVERKLPKEFRQKLLIAAHSVENATPETEAWAAKNEVKSTKVSTSGVFFSFGACFVVKDHDPPTTAHTTIKEKSWRVGGAPHEKGANKAGGGGSKKPKPTAKKTVQQKGRPPKAG